MRGRFHRAPLVHSNRVVGPLFKGSLLVLQVACDRWSESEIRSNKLQKKEKKTKDTIQLKVGMVEWRPDSCPLKPH